MAGRAWRVWCSAVFGQCGNRAVQGIAQVMQGRNLQSQRQCADIQVDETATFAVHDLCDKSVGERAVITRSVHDQDSMANRCSGAAGDGLPARKK